MRVILVPSWMEIYSRALESAVFLYANQDFVKLRFILEMMPGQIYHKNASEELKAFTAMLDDDKARQEAEIDKKAQTQTTYLDKRRVYGQLDAVELWYLTELVKKHQELAQKYDLLPRETDIIKGV